MRTVHLLPLAAMVAAVAGCGSQGRESAALSLPQRDLTLAAQAREVDIASPVELGSLRAQHRTMRASRTLRLRPARRSTPVEDKYAPAAVAAAPLAALGAGSAIVLTVAHPAAQPAAVAAVPASDRELLPGKTVTVIPASSGPSNGVEGTDESPTIRRGWGGGGSGMGGGGSGMGGGGRCPGRGPDIGIAGLPQPSDFR